MEMSLSKAHEAQVFISSDEDDVTSHLSMESLEDEAPPAYDDLSRAPSTISSSDTAWQHVLPSIDRLSSSQRPFPVAFNLYSKSNKWKNTSFLLGEHVEQPTNAVVLQSSWKGTTLTLHQSIDTAAAALASVAPEESPRSQHAIVSLPQHSGENGQILTVSLRTSVHLARVSYSFSMEVLGNDHNEPSHLEHFEWRISHGKEVKQLDQRSWGWKLVRLGSELPPDRDERHHRKVGSRKAPRDYGMTSDGKEVVAVWADYSKASKNKIGKFSFLGSAAAGAMGVPWEIVAVVTGLRIWQNVNGKLGSWGSAPSPIGSRREDAGIKM